MADAPTSTAAAHSFPAWWAGTGRPGWSPEAIQASGMPWTLAGLTQGAWRIEDPFASGASATPGIPEAQLPLAWYDSTRVVFGEGGAWNGFGATLATAEGFMKPSGTHKPRAVYTMMSSDGGVDRHGILVSRGDERSWLHAGAVAGKRSGIADLGPAGDHVWGFVTGARRGAHVFSAHFSQRGMGESLKDSYSVLGESAKGASGQLSWDSGPASLRISRTQDTRASFSPYNVIVPSRRDAWTNAAAMTLRRKRGALEMEWLASWSESRTRRLTANVPRFEAWDHQLWTAARARAPLLGGNAEVALGGGVDRMMARKRERWQLAPSFAWRRVAGEQRLRVFGERVLTPVWSDLDVSVAQKPFMQDCWVGGLEANRGVAGKRSAEATVMAGRVGARATTLRYPVRDASLRFQGWAPDPLPYGFLLAQASGEWTGRLLGADARGYAMARDLGARVGNVDPAVGGALGVSAAFKVFAGDLAGRLRAEAAWVGARDSDARVEFFPEQTLPGYFTLAASAAMAVGDMSILMRMDNLENERHPQSWVNPAAAELELARGSARRFRLELSWPLFN